MSDIKQCSLILIENRQVTRYLLDQKPAWEIGRVSESNHPDIPLFSATVSQKHGRFQNMDGLWFYLDLNSKNGTIHNHKYIKAGLRKRIKPVMLRDGDSFIFGGGEEEVINYRTIFGLFLEEAVPGKWSIVYSGRHNRICLQTSKHDINLENPEKGTVIRQDGGIAVYMGDFIYFTGDMNVTGF